MLARYCLLALAALTVLVDASGRGRSVGRYSRGGRGRVNVNIRNTNEARNKRFRTKNRANITPKKLTVNNSNSKKITPKTTQFKNNQKLKLQQNNKKSHSNSNSGLSANNFFKSHVGKTRNDNRIRATKYAKVNDNEQGSKQKVRSGHLGITGNLQPYNGGFFGGGGLFGTSGGAQDFSSLGGTPSFGGAATPSFGGATSFDGANLSKLPANEVEAEAAPEEAEDEAAEEEAEADEPAAEEESAEDEPTDADEIEG